VASALLLPNSKQWDASAGCYVTSMLDSIDIPIQDFQTEAYYIGDSSSGVNLPFCSSISASTSSITGATFSRLPTCDMTSFNMCGAIFTGLAANSALTINWNVVVERFPTNDNLDLVVLADPSPEYDEVALKAYSHISRSLPVGVPVKMNGLGDWFKEAISTVSDFVSPVLSAIPHPIAQGISAGLRVTNGLVNGRGGGGAASAPSPYVNVAAPPAQVVAELVPQAPALGNYKAPRRGGLNPRSLNRRTNNTGFRDLAEYNMMKKYLPNVGALNKIKMRPRPTFNQMVDKGRNARKEFRGARKAAGRRKRQDRVLADYGY